MKLRNLLYILMVVAFSLPSFAVSDKDMEQAKVIAAKLYLRWTNNGSGYLDEVSASSMADLESKLKDQEKENLKAFKSVSIPSDYASWDKERFVQFWGTTFFTSPALTADGKRAKDRVKAKVSTIKVSAPTAKAEEPKGAEASADEKKEPEKKEEKAEQPADGRISIPEPQEVVHQQEEAIADSLHVLQAEEQSLALPDEKKKAKSHTWIYVVILVVLVILVVWLMIYAANMMKSQGKEVRDVKGEDKKAKKEIASLEAENDRLKKEISRLNEAMQSRIAANEALKSEAEAAKAEIARLRSALKKAEEKAPLREQPAAVAAAPRRQEEPKPQQPKILNEIYLGRANAKGLFVRGDRRPNPGHTIYKLDTKDGIVGTFRVLNSPDTFELATSNPIQFLAGGCVCENFEEAETADKIVTETPGTAILENGCWKVLRKSRIRFE